MTTWTRTEALLACIIALLVLILLVVGINTRAIRLKDNPVPNGCLVTKQDSQSWVISC